MGGVFRKIIVNRLEPATWSWLGMNGEEMEVASEFAEEPAVKLHIEAESEREVLLCFSGDAAWKKRKLEIKVARDVEAKVIVLLEVKSDERLFLHTSLILEEGSKLEVKKVILSEGLCVEESEAHEKAFSSLKADYCAVGGRTYSKLLASMDGEGSSFTSDFSYLCKGRDILDINFTARHKGEKSRSLMRALGSLSDFAGKTYRGTIDFVRGAKGATGSESEEVLVFSPDVVNKSAPLILCGEEDVVGDHAATIGKLASEMLFYMMSRGVPKEKVERLLAVSFVSSFSSSLWSEEVKEKIYEKCLKSEFPLEEEGSFL